MHSSFRLILPGGCGRSRRWCREAVYFGANGRDVNFALARIRNSARFVKKDRERKSTFPFFRYGDDGLALVVGFEQIGGHFRLHFSEELRDVAVNVGEIVERDDDKI